MAVIPWGGRPTQVVPGEILVSLRPGYGAADADALARSLGSQVLSWTPQLGALRLRVPEGTSLSDFARLTQGAPEVLEASPNRILRATSACETETASYGEIQWPLDRIAAGALCQSGEGDGLVTARVAVLDSGVAYGAASDLQGTYAQAPGLSEVTFDILPDSDLVNGDSVPADDYYHGTHITSIIANRSTIAGVSPNVSVVPIKILDAGGVGSESTLAEGLLLAAAAGVDVINLSVAFEPGYRPSWALQQAIRAAAESGALLIGSSGNAGVGEVQYPGAFPDVMAVGAGRLEREGSCADASTAILSDTPASYSSHGYALDLMAPGGSVIHNRNCDNKVDVIFAETIQTRPKDVTAFEFLGVTGTSQAAAHVSGLALWLVAHAPGISPAALRQALLSSSHGLDPEAEDAFAFESGAGMASGAGLLTGTPAPPEQAIYVNILPVLASNPEGAVFGRAQIEVMGVGADGIPTPLAGVQVLGAFAGSTYGPFAATTDTKGVAWVDAPAMLPIDSETPLSATVTFEVQAVVDPAAPYLPQRPRGFYQLGAGLGATLEALLQDLPGEGAVLPTSEAFVFFAVDPGEPSIAPLGHGAPLAPAYIYKTLGAGGATAPMASVVTPAFLGELQAEGAQEAFTVALGEALAFSWGERDVISGGYFAGSLQNLPFVSSAVILPLDGLLAGGGEAGAVILNAHWDTWESENEGFNTGADSAAIASGYSATLFGTGYSATLFGTITQEAMFYADTESVILIGAGAPPEPHPTSDAELGACTVDGCAAGEL